MRLFLVLALGLLGLVLVSPVVGVSGSTSESVVGVCTGVPGCDVKAHVDIDGDGHKDAVGIASRGSASGRRVIIRVKTSATHIESVRRPTPYWFGSQWQGTAQLDGRLGREVVVGHMMGAHAQLYRSLTWRHGGLRHLDAPGRESSWMIDSAIWTSMGWKRGARSPAGFIKHRTAVRTGDTRSHFKGTVLSYSWTQDGWKRVNARKFPSISDRRARRWGGFHVPGLARW